MSWFPAQVWAIMLQNTSSAYFHEQSMCCIKIRPAPAPSRTMRNIAEMLGRWTSAWEAATYSFGSNGVLVTGGRLLKVVGIGGEDFGVASKRLAPIDSPS